MLNERRIRKAIKASYAKARAAIADARESRGEFFKKAALEVVQECRRLNADRRRALACGSTV